MSKVCDSVCSSSGQFWLHSALTRSPSSLSFSPLSSLWCLLCKVLFSSSIGWIKLLLPQCFRLLHPSTTRCLSYLLLVWSITHYKNYPYKASFPGEHSLMSQSRGLTVVVIYFHHKHSVNKSFLLVTDAVFWAEMWQRVGRTGGGFSSYKLQKTVTVTTLLLFGHVTLLCGKFLFIELSEGPVHLSECMTDTWLICSHWFGSPIMQLVILPQEVDEHRSEISPLAASETFTQRRMRRIAEGSPHANGSVKGAIVAQSCQQTNQPTNQQIRRQIWLKTLMMTVSPYPISEHASFFSIISRVVSIIPSWKFGRKCGVSCAVCRR